MKGSANPFPRVKFAVQVADPATPPEADHVFIFLRDDGNWYVMDDTGAVEQFAGAGGFGGGVNVEQRDPPVAAGVHTDGGWVSGTATTVSNEAYKTLVPVAAGNLGLTAAPTVDPRIDLIGVDRSGALVAFAGTESATPVPPTISQPEVTPLYLVHRRVGETQVLNEDNGTDAYLEDIRGAAALNPWLIHSASQVRLGRLFTGILDSRLEQQLTFHPSLGAILEATGAAGQDVTLKPHASTGKQIMSGGVGIVMPKLSADPAGGDSETGQMYYNDVSDELRWYDGAAWNPFGGGGATDLDGLSDVDVSTTPPSDGDVLTFDIGDSLWKPAAPGGGGGSLSTDQATLGADVTLVSADTYTDVLSLTLAAGTWLLLAVIHVTNTTTTLMHITARLSETTGPTHYASAGKSEGGQASTSVSIPLLALVTLGSSTTIKLQAATTAIAPIVRAALVQNGNGNNATRFVAIKIA